MKKIKFALAIGLTSISMHLFAAEVPVIISADEGLDACGGLLKVANLNPNGDNFLALRSGPGTSYPMILKLGPDTKVLGCDWRDGWSGIVVNTGEGNLYDCAVEPAADARPYSDHGKCVSGWVSDKYLLLLAG